MPIGILGLELYHIYMTKTFRLAALAVCGLAVGLSVWYALQSGNITREQRAGSVKAASTDSVLNANSQIQSQDLSDVAPEVYQGSYFYTDSMSALEAMGVRIYSEDIVTAFPEPSLGIGFTINVYRAQSVLIKDGKHEVLVRTWAKDVKSLLNESRIDLGDKDAVKPELTSLISHTDRLPVVVITRVSEAEVKEYKSIEYVTKYIDDPNMLRGESKVDVKGALGTREYTYLVKRENGEEVSRKLISQKVSKEAVNEIIKRGTKIIVYGTGKASWYGGVPSMTAAHPSLPFGTMVRVVNVNNGKSVVVRIADRGPFVVGRIIDLSDDAFAQIASLGTGVVNVRVEKE